MIPMSTYRLNELFNPRSIALVGASPKEQSLGHTVLKNLLAAGFPGPVPVETLRSWIDEGSIETSHYYCAYPQASAKEILAGPEVRRRLREFNERTRDMDASRFAQEYQALVFDLQLQI